MKKINKILALSFLLCAGSMQVVKAEDGRYDNKDGELLCRLILTTDIAILKGFILPGNELSAVKLLMPEMKIDNGFAQYLTNSTFLHLLIDEIDSCILENLKLSFSQNEIDTYRAKLVELIKYAISVGIDINIENLDGQTALSLAVENGTVDMVELLIQSGANINHQDIDGLTTLHDAVNDQIENLFFVAFFTTLDPSCLLQDDEELFAQVKAREKIIEILIQNGADLSIENADDETVLDYLNISIEEVNEMFDYYEFDGVYSINIFGFSVDIYHKKDLHNSLTVFKNELVALQKLLQK